MLFQSGRGEERCSGLTLGSWQPATQLRSQSPFSTGQWEKMRNEKLEGWDKDGEITCQLPSQQNSFHGLQGNICSSTVSPQAAGNLCSGLGAAPPTPLSLALLFPGPLLTFCCCAVFCPFLSLISRRGHQPCWWAHLWWVWLEPDGTGCVQLGHLHPCCQHLNTYTWYKRFVEKIK